MNQTVGQRHTPEQIEAREGAIQRQKTQRQKTIRRKDWDSVTRWNARIAFLESGKMRD